MKNNRAQFFGLYLIILTLFLCGMAIGTYSTQQKTLHTSLVSPREIISIQTDLEIFEIREAQLIEDSLKITGGDFSSPDFTKDFRNNFLNSFRDEVKMKDFITDHLTVDGVDFEDSVNNDFNNFLENRLYPERNVEIEDGKLYFSRGIVGKKIMLVGRPVRINFPVNVTYEFGREYLIRFENNEYIVEKI